MTNRVFYELFSLMRADHNLGSTISWSQRREDMTMPVEPLHRSYSAESIATYIKRAKSLEMEVADMKDSPRKRALQSRLATLRAIVSAATAYDHDSRE